MMERYLEEKDKFKEFLAKPAEEKKQKTGNKREQQKGMETTAANW